MDNWTGGAHLAAGFERLLLPGRQMCPTRSRPAPPARYGDRRGKTVTEIAFQRPPRLHLWSLISTDGSPCGGSLRRDEPLAHRGSGSAPPRGCLAPVRNRGLGHAGRAMQSADRYVAVTDVGAPARTGGRHPDPLLETPNDPHHLGGDRSRVRGGSSAPSHPWRIASILSEFVDTYARVRITGPLGLHPVGGAAARPRGDRRTALPADEPGPPRAIRKSSCSGVSVPLTTSWGVYRHRPGEDSLETLDGPPISASSPRSSRTTGPPRPTEPGSPTTWCGCPPRAKAGAALIYAYGGFNAPWVPQSPPERDGRDRRGGRSCSSMPICAVAPSSVSSGGKGGACQNKQNCYADLYAVAEDLIARGAHDAGATGSDRWIERRADVRRRHHPTPRTFGRQSCRGCPFWTSSAECREPYGYVTSKLEFGEPGGPRRSAAHGGVLALPPGDGRHRVPGRLHRRRRYGPALPGLARAQVRRTPASGQHRRHAHPGPHLGERRPRLGHPTRTSRSPSTPNGWPS